MSKDKTSACPVCGTPLDHIPLGDCHYHRLLDAMAPSFVEEEYNDYLDEYYRLTIERTGDD